MSRPRPAPVVSGNVILLQLTPSGTALIDAVLPAEILDQVLPYRWRVTPKGYVAQSRQGGTYLHRVVSGAGSGEHAHHLGDKLDNRRSQLKVMTQREHDLYSQRWRGPKKGNRFKGIYRSSANRWGAQIRIPGEGMRHIGSFPSAEDAARAWNEAAIALRGDDQWLNPV
jgi:hypothetical protein